MFGDFQIGNARFNPHGAIGKIHIQHARHFAETDDNRIFLRNRTTRQRCPRTARHNFDTLPVAISHHGSHHFRVFGQSHSKRHFAISGQRIGFKSPSFILGNNQTFGG